MSKPRYKGFYNIKSNEAKKEATIYIYGVIGGFNWDTWTYENTADQFIKDFKDVEANNDTIHVKINSPGGNIHDGLPIYNVLKNSEKKILTYVDGIAYSMAAMIALAGDEVIGYANSLFMVHNGSTIAMGNAEELRTESEVLNKYDMALGTIIEEKLGITDSAVAEKYLNYKDNFFTAKEAKSEGFFDSIITSKKAAVPENVQNMNSKDLIAHYAKMNLEIEETPSPKPETQPKNNLNTMTERKNVQAVLGLDAPLASTENGSYLNDAQLDTLETNLADSATALATAEAATQTATDALATEQATVTDLGASLNALAVTAGIEAAATTAETITALTNRITELGQEPGAVHTVVTKKETKTEGMPDYVDLNNSIYTHHKN